LLAGRNGIFRLLRRSVGVALVVLGLRCEAQVTLPAFIGFEASENFTPGNLNSQGGWVVSQGSASVVSETFHSGSQSLEILPGAPPSVASQSFADSGGETVEFFDFYAIPVAESSIASSTLFTAEGAKFGFQASNGRGVLQVFSGNGNGSGVWAPTLFTIPLGSGNQAATWVRLTARLDFTEQTWNLYSNGALVAASVPFTSDSSTYLSSFGVQGDGTTASYVDAISAGPTSPLTDDTNANGIPDSWEMQYLGTLNHTATDDPGGVGRTLLQSYIQGLSPWPAPVVPNGLQAWYRADEGVQVDASNNVTQWTDLSGNGYHVDQASDVSKEPLLVAGAMNGQSAIQFTPQRVLNTSAVANLESTGNDVTVIAVISAGASQGYGSTIYSWGTDGNVAFGLSSNASNSYLLYWGADSGNTVNSPPTVAVAGQVQVLSEVKNGTAATAYLNGTLTGVGAVPANMAKFPAALAMGNAAYPYYGFTGEIAELMVYNRALSDTERQQIEAQLAAKYVNADTNNNGIPDTWEMQYLGNLSHAATDDPGNVGRTLLQSYQQGLSPWPSPVVAGGLQAWYRADEGVTADASNNVTAWADLSGNGYHVSQTADPTKEPHLVPGAMNGQPAVQFVPQQILKTTALENIESGGTDVTMIAVIAPAATQSGGATVYSWGTDGNVAFGLSSNASNSYLLYWGADTGSTVNTPPAAATPGQVQVLSEVKDGTTASAYLNGLSVGMSTVPAGMAQTPASLALGNAAYPYYGFSGQIAEVLVYNRALSDTERHQVEAQLTAKYVNADTNNNGIPDTWEMQYLGNLRHAATDDPGNVGRTLLQSYQQGLSPWPSPVVAGGLQAWYRADEGVTADASNNVTAWTDLSGNGYHVSQTVDSTKEPLLVPGAMNGQPAVQFVPQQTLKTTDLENIESGGSDVTVIAVIAPAATQSGGATVYSWGTDGNVAFGLSSNANNSYLLYWGTDTGSTVNTPPAAATPGQVQVLSEVKDGTTASAYLNGLSVGMSTVPAGMAQTPASLALGNAAYPYYGFSGQIAEVLVYNRALSDTERHQVEAQLTAKYVNADTNNNGIPDTWEMQYLGNLNHAATDDPGSVGRTLLQSYQQGLSPWPLPVVASGLQAWYRADKGVVTDSSNKVTQWTDLSGRGFHVTQTVDPTKEPLLVTAAMNGNPAVQFVPQQVLKTAAVENIESGGTDVTVIAVVAPAASQGTGSTVYSWGTDGNVAFGLSSNATNSYVLYWGADNGNTVNTPAAAATSGQVQVLSEVKSGTSATAYLNGSSTGTSTVPAGMAPTSGALAMGNAAYPYYGFTGQVAEVLVYNRALTDTERQQIEESLTAKYVNPDSNANGIPDTWEMQYLGTLSHTASDDPGGVGRTLLQSYQQDLSPWPAPVVGGGLKAWYRADEGVTSDSGNNVSQWADLSGNGFHVSQTVDPSKEPLLVGGAMNGHPVVQFTPQQILKTPAVESIEAGASDVTVIAVIEPNESQGYGSTVYSWGTDGNVAFGLSSNATNSYLLYWGAENGGTYNSPAVTATGGQAQIISEVKDGTTSAAYLNGASIGTNVVPAGMAVTPGVLAMGNAAYPYYGFTGQVAEVLVYNRALADSERQQIEAQLTARYMSTAIPLPVTDGLLLDLNAATGVVADSSGNVSQWTDQSPAANNAVQATQTNQPQLIPNSLNAAPTLSFNGSDFMALPPNMMQSVQSGEIIGVVAYGNAPDLFNTAWEFGTGNGTSYFNTTHYDDFGTSDSSGAAVENPAEIAAFHISDTSIENGTAIYRYNGVPLWTRTGLTQGFQQTPYLGGFASGSFIGNMAEVLVYDRVLTDAERFAIGQYLTAKYAFPAITAPAAPTDLLATAQSSDTVDLSWSAPYQQMHTVTYVSRSSGSSPMTQIAQVNDATGFTDTSLSAGVTYTYQISVQSYIGTSEASNISAVTTPTGIMDIPQSGLAMWLRSTTGTEGAGPLSVWVDESGSGNSALQTTEAQQPQVVDGQANGLPVIRFNGSNTLTLPANMLQAAQSGQIIAVVKVSGDPNNFGMLWNFGTGYGSTFAGGGHLDDFGTSDTSNTPLQPSEQINQYFVYDTALGIGGDSTYRYDGTPMWTRTGLPLGFQQYPDIGGYGNGNFIGDIAEIIIYDRVLTTTEQATVYNYLAQKFALPAVVANLGLPAITSPSNPSVTIGSTFSYQIVGTNGPTGFTASGLPDGISIDPNTGIISGTPTAIGSYIVSISASNTFGAGSSQLTIAVNPPPPTITSATTDIGLVGQPYSFQIVATNNPTSFEAGGLPDGLSLDSTAGLISGTPTTAGPSTVTLSATNAGGSGTAFLALTISSGTAAPSITSSATAPGQAGQAFSYQIVATNDPTNYSATGLPPWLAVDPISGLITGVPAQAQIGTFEVTIMATNPLGSASEQVTVTIAALGPVASGMILWLEADTGIQTQMVGGVSTAVWADQSGLGNNATQSAVLNGSIQTPTFNAVGPNGHALVHFTATSQQFLELPPLLNSVTSGDLFVVLRASNSTGLTNAKYWGAWTLGPNGTGFTNTTVADDFLSASQYLIGSAPINLGAFNLYNSTASPAAWASRLNGGTLSSSSTNTPASPAAADPSGGNYGTAIGVGHFAPPVTPTPTPTPTPSPPPDC
jgi:hypothetical protein